MAIQRSVEALREGRVEHEPAMTDRMLGTIEEIVNHASHTRDEANRAVLPSDSDTGQTVGELPDLNEDVRVRWHAKTLTDRGRGSQESIFGADFAGVLDIQLDDYKVSKGFLAQAKLIRAGGRINRKDLVKQCEQMLGLSPASYVFLYSKRGVRVVPAVAIVGASGYHNDCYDRSAKRFFEEHLACFIGDGALNVAGPEGLESLRERATARSALLIQGRPDRQRSRSREDA